MRQSVVHILLLACLLLLSRHALAYTQTELETFDNEAPIVKDLLERASALDNNASDVEASWKAANLYCEAARYGSAEAVYRLGMLYAFGRGVPANKDYAANLFDIAAVNGHFEAQKMLGTIEIKTRDTPACVVEAVAPAHVLAKIESSAIDAYIANLPKKNAGQWIWWRRLPLGTR